MVIGGQRNDKRLYYLLLLFCVFVNIQEFLLVPLKGPGWLSGIDEAVAVSAFFFGFRLIRFKEFRWVAVLLLLPLFSFFYGLGVSYFFFDSVRLTDIAIQSIINNKIFLYFVVFLSLHRTHVIGRCYFGNIIKVCLIVSLLGFLVNMAVPSFFVYSEAEYALDRQRFIGFQFKPNDLAIFMAFVAGFYLLRFDKGGIGRGLSVVLALLVFLSTSRTGLLILMIASLAFLYRNKKFHLPAVLFGGGALVLALSLVDVSQFFIVSETISNLSEFSAIDSSQYIRFIMIAYGVLLAGQYFPIGVGTANFGTVMSVDSPVYAQLGLSRISFFEDMQGVFDSNLASVLGEYGFLGVLLFGGAAYLILKRLPGFYSGNIWVGLLMVFCVALLQPLFSYQVNSVNFLLLIFALAESSLNDGSMRSKGLH